MSPHADMAPCGSAQRTWSGDWDPDKLVPKEEITTVNLRKVGDLVEGVVADLRAQHSTGCLRISPSMTIEQFHVRYGMRWRMPQGLALVDR